MSNRFFSLPTALIAVSFAALLSLSGCGASDPASAVSNVQTQPGAAASKKATPKRNAVGQTVKEAPKKVVNGVDCSIVPRTADELIAYKKFCTDTPAEDEAGEDSAES